MKKITIIALLITVVTIGQAIAGPDYVYGNLSNYSAAQYGLLIMVDTGIPDNCAGSPYNWMVIPNEDKALLAMALMRISQDQLGVTIYSSGVFYNGICRVTQYDPN
jgi:hypothetical protein